MNISPDIISGLAASAGVAVILLLSVKQYPIGSIKISQSAMAGSSHSNKNYKCLQGSLLFCIEWLLPMIFFKSSSLLLLISPTFVHEPLIAGLAAAREQGRIGGRSRVMTEEVVERCRRMLENGATRQQVAEIYNVGVKTIYKYLPVAPKL